MLMERYENNFSMVPVQWKLFKKIANNLTIGLFINSSPTNSFARWKQFMGVLGIPVEPEIIA
jgi:hypothetical protein